MLCYIKGGFLVLNPILDMIILLYVRTKTLILKV